MAFPTTVDTIVDGTTVGHASQVLGPQRITVGPTMYNVLSDQYGGGADPSGVADSSTAIAAAETAAAATGGTVYFPQGTYLAKGLNIDSNVHWVGAGEGATILKQPSAGNTFVVQSTNFATLTGGNTTGGVTNCSINSMTIDGNKAQNASATVPVVRIYGYGYRLRDLRIKNGNNEGLYSEWSTSLPSPGADSMMAFLSNLKVHDCGSHGVHWNGPHDSQWTLGEVFNNGARGVFADTQGNGLLLVGVHSWGLTQTYAGFFGTTGCGSVGSVFEGAITAQLGIDGNDCWVNGGFIYGAGASVPVGIQLGVTGTRQDVAIVGTKINNCTSGALVFTNDGGSLIVADIFQSGGTLTTGTISINSRHTLRTNGVAGSVDRLNGGLELHGGSALKLYSAADGGFATFSFDGAKALSTWPLVTSTQTPAFAASFTPNFAAGDTIAMAALTGNVTVNAPTGGVAGQKITFIWLQDGTGTRTITYNAVYKTTGTGAVTAITTGANTRTIDRFTSEDGTSWRLCSRITGQ